MFGMGFTELLFIAVIAVLFLGPEKLPQAMVDIARFLKKIKGTIADTKEDLERELQISDLKAEMLSYKTQLTDMTDDVKDLSPKHMLQSEINDINESIYEANPMNERVSLDADPATEPPKKKSKVEKTEKDETSAKPKKLVKEKVPAKPKKAVKAKAPLKEKTVTPEQKVKKKSPEDPYHEAVTFKKKRTKVIKDEIKEEGQA